MSNNHIDIEEYIDLHQLMEKTKTTHENNRQFGLAHEQLLKTPTGLLKLWIEEHRYLLLTPLMSQRISSYLNKATALLLVVAFLLGIFSGFGLLSYSGKEPVNVLYFLAAVVLLPLVTMSMTLWAMMRANRSANMLVHISPAYWMERAIALLPDKSRDMVSELHINPQISNWITLRRSQALALAFSLGLLLALIGVVASRDIAFGWSSTLRITPEELYSMLSLLALPWREFLPEALPSLELIEKSHYFRLGGKLSADMVHSASLLGEWWKFLAMVTLFYALFLRALLFLGATVGLHRALDRGALAIDGVREILSEMQTALISTEAVVDEVESTQSTQTPQTTSSTTDGSFGSVIGWAMDRDIVALHNDRTGIKGVDIYEAGGMHSLESDQQVIESISRDTLLYVKSWEPPTMDFVDFVSDLVENSGVEVTLYPLGSPDESYRASDRDYEMWATKLGSIRVDNIRIRR